MSKNESEYREAFIGGGSIYLAGGFENAWINDLDTGVYDLWRLVKEDPGLLIDLFKKHGSILDHKEHPERIQEALDLWRSIQKDTEAKVVPLGYRTLFLNKTCFSGVLTGGPTGGLHQTGKYKINARWAQTKTIQRIMSAHEQLKTCRITNYSYEQVVSESGKDVVLYLDPPYLIKGKQCYEKHFNLEDHQKFAKNVVSCGHRYIVTVDDCVELRSIWTELVDKQCVLTETWLYSMSDFRDKNREGKEMFVVDSKTLSLFPIVHLKKNIMKELC